LPAQASGWVLKYGEPLTAREPCSRPIWNNPVSGRIYWSFWPRPTVSDEFRTCESFAGPETRSLEGFGPFAKGEVDLRLLPLANLSRYSRNSFAALYMNRNFLGNLK